MKFSALLAFCAACAPLTAHAQTIEPDDALPALPPMTRPRVPVVDAYLWKFAPPVGSRWTMRAFTRTQTEYAIPTKDGSAPIQSKTNGFTRVVADYDVLNRDTFGASTIRVSYRELAIGDTATTNGKLTASTAFGQGVLKDIDGASFTLKMAPDGKIWGIDGLDTVRDQLLKANAANASADDDTRVGIAKLARSIAAEKFVRETMGRPLGSWPTYPIRAGENWNYASSKSIGTPADIALETRRSLKSLDPEIAAIDETALYQNDSFALDTPNNRVAPNVALSMENLKFGLTGFARVQRSSGIALQSSTVENVSGTIEYDFSKAANARDASGALVTNAQMPIKSTIDTRIVIEPRA